MRLLQEEHGTKGTTSQAARLAFVVCSSIASASDAACDSWNPKNRAHQTLNPKLSNCSFKMAHLLEEQPPNLKLHMKVVHILKHIIQLFIKVGLIEQPHVCLKLHHCLSLVHRCKI